MTSERGRPVVRPTRDRRFKVGDQVKVDHLSRGMNRRYRFAGTVVETEGVIYVAMDDRADWLVTIESEHGNRTVVGEDWITEKVDE